MKTSALIIAFLLALLPVVGRSQVLSGRVVNIDAAVYGDPASGFPTVQVPVLAGTYRLTEVSPDNDSRAAYWDWSPYSFQGTWMSTLWIHKGYPGKLTKIAQIGNDVFYNTPQEAFKALNNQSILVSIETDGYLSLGVDDNILYDNRGGVSLKIEGVPTDLVSFSVAPTQIASGLSVVGTVSLASPAPSGGVTVSVSSDSDCAVVPSTYTVPEGQSSGTFTIAAAAVATKRVANISVIQGTTSKTAKLTVVPAVLAAISVSPASVFGGVSSGATVSLSGAAPAGGITVVLSSDKGFATVPSSVTIPVGAKSAKVSIATSAVGADGVATISASYASVVRSSSLTVKAPTLAAFSVSPASVLGGVKATGTVTLGSVAPVGGLDVTLGSDSTFASVPAKVTIVGGATRGTFTVTTSGVQVNGVATISAQLGSVMKSSSLTVTAPLVAAVSLSPAAVVGGANGTGTVTLATTAPVGGMVVSLASDSTFASVPASVTVPAGLLSVKFTVATLAVTVNSVATVSAVTWGQAKTGKVTVKAPLVVAFSISPASVLGGASATGTVTLGSAAPAGGLDVGLSSDSGFAGVPSKLTVAGGAVKGTFSVTTSPVSATSLAAVSTTLNGATVTAKLTVKPPYLAAFSVSPVSVLGGGSVSGTVTLASPAPVGGTVVALSSDSAIASVPPSVTVLAGAISARFPIDTLIVGADSTATISASLSGVTIKSTLKVRAPVLAAFSVSPASVVGGKNVSGTVTLSSPAPVGGMAVSLGSDSGFASVPSTVTVPGGSLSVRFTVTTTVVSVDSVATITASLGSVSKGAVLTVKH